MDEAAQNLTDIQEREAQIERAIPQGVLTFVTGLVFLAVSAVATSGGLLPFIGLCCIPPVCFVSLLLPIAIAVSAFSLAAKTDEDGTAHFRANPIFWKPIGDTFYTVRHGLSLLIAALLLAIPLLAAASTIWLDAALNGIWFTPTRSFSFSEVVAAGGLWLIFVIGLLLLNPLAAFFGLYIGMETRPNETRLHAGLVLVGVILAETLLGSLFIGLFWWLSIHYHETGRVVALMGGCIIAPLILVSILDRAIRRR